MSARDKKPRFMAASDVARDLGVSRWTVYRLINENEIESMKVRGRVLVDVASIDAYIERHRRAS